MTDTQESCIVPHCDQRRHHKGACNDVLHPDNAIGRIWERESYEAGKQAERARIMKFVSERLRLLKHESNHDEYTKDQQLDSATRADEIAYILSNLERGDHE